MLNAVCFVYHVQIKLLKEACFTFLKTQSYALLPAVKTDMNKLPDRMI
jgi:hypothetical protein